MKLDKGLNRDIDYNNQPVGTYRFANNLVLPIGGDRLESEKGVSELASGYMTSTNIGKIIPPNEIILFNYVTNYGTTLPYLVINRYKDEELITSVYTDLFNISLDSPIQGEYYYNYKGELIIFFYSDIDIPRLINLDNLGFHTINNKIASSADEILTRQYITSNLTTVDLIGVNSNGGNLKSGVYQLSIQYKLPDKSYTNFLPFSNPIFVNSFNKNDDWYNIFAEESGKITNKLISIKLNDIDDKFKQFRFGIYYKTASETKAYVTDDYYVTGNECLISDFNTFTEITLSDLLVKNVSLKRIGASTVIDNTLYLGNIQYNDEIKYQKYANNIKVNYVVHDDVVLDEYKNSYKDEVVLFRDKTFMPFEVYALYIRFYKRSDGQPTYAFHIPGRELNPTELSEDTGDGHKIYTNAKNFHFNDKSIHVGSQMGVWQNENELYPDDDEFDGTVDYDNTPIENGVLLKGKNVRHHRFPSYSFLQKYHNFLHDNTLSNQQLYVNFANPIAGSNCCKFNSRTDTPDGYGEFTDFATWKNTSNYTITFDSDILFFSIESDATGVTDGSLKLELQKLDNYGVATIIDSESGIYNNHSFKISLYKYNTPITLAPNESFRIKVCRYTSSGQIYSEKSIRYVGGYSYMQSTNINLGSNTALYGKKLGIKLSNIEIPQYIADECSHYEILYAERGTSNITVLGYETVHNYDFKKNESPKLNYLKTDNFDALYNKNSLNISALIPQLIVDDAFVDRNTTVTPINIDSTNLVVPVKVSKYVPYNVGFTTPNNRTQNEAIHLELYNEYDIGSIIPSGTNIIIDPITKGIEGHCINMLLSFKPDLYTSFYNQKLVRTGKLFKIENNDSDIIVETDNIYGGDVVIAMHGVTRYTNLKNCPDNCNANEWIDYELYPTFSISNIGYRWLDESKPEQIFFPKYNCIETNGEGYKGLQSSGNIQKGNVGSVESIIDRIPPSDDTGSNQHLFIVGEYYGYENILNSVNNIESSIIYNSDLDFITGFKDRIYRTLIQSTENIKNSWRVIKANEYFDSINNKGEIVQLDTDGVDLLIEHRYSLFVVKALNQLEINENVVVALGNSDIFDNKPIEIMSDDNGYVGCQSRFTSFRCKFGNFIVDRSQGKMFLYNKYKVEEITLYGLNDFFESNLQYSIKTDSDDGVWLFGDGNEILFDDSKRMLYGDTVDIYNTSLLYDNPFINKGLIATYDEEYERIIISKNANDILADDTFTISYYPKHKYFVSFHNYIPNNIFSNRLGLFKIDNYSIGTYNNYLRFYKMNDSTTYGLFETGGIVQPVELELCFAYPYGIDKATNSFSWVTNMLKLTDSQNIETFDNAVVYNDIMHSDSIKLIISDFTSGNLRNTNASWKFNDFMNVLKNYNLQILDKNKVDELLVDGLDSSDVVTNWYDKSPFVYNYIILKLIYANNQNGISIAEVSINNKLVGRI